MSLSAMHISRVCDLFNRLSLPVPDAHSGARMNNGDGYLVFSNQLGVTIRVGNGDTYGEGKPKINDSPLIIQPLADLGDDDLVFEISPGVHLCDEPRDVFMVSHLLEKFGGLNFWDMGTHNTGRLPLASPEFPQGIPVIIDRPSVEPLTKGAKDVARILAAIGVERDPQDIYAPLRAAFARAWNGGAPAKGAMRGFWERCAEAVQAGVLVAGWNEYRSDGFKLEQPRKAAVVYDRQMKNEGF